MSKTTVFSLGTPQPIQVEGDRLWVYDEVRNKWLSAERSTIIAGRKGRAKNSYLRLSDGQSSNLSGYRMPRTGTIVSIMAQTRATETWTVRIRKNGSDTDVASLTLTDVEGYHDSSLDINVEEGDRIQIFAETTGFLGIRDPFIWVEIAWRNDAL